MMTKQNGASMTDANMTRVGKGTSITNYNGAAAPTIEMPQATPTGAAWDLPRYRMKVDEYRSYRRNGYLIVRGLVEQPDVENLRTYAMDLLHGRIALPGAPQPTTTDPQELYKRFSRLHMLHRQFETAAALDGLKAITNNL